MADNYVVVVPVNNLASNVKPVGQVAEKVKVFTLPYHIRERKKVDFDDFSHAVYVKRRNRLETNVCFFQNLQIRRRIVEIL